MERWLAEIRLRAKRRIGELSRELETSAGAGGHNRRSSQPREEPTKKATLAAAGLSTSEANRCEKLAAVPEAAFEEVIEKAKAGPALETGEKIIRVGPLTHTHAPPSPRLGDTPCRAAARLLRWLLRGGGCRVRVRDGLRPGVAGGATPLPLP